MIYFDNAATSWPKPQEVGAAMQHFLAEIGANPGRAGHRLAIEAGRIVYNVRETMAAFLHAPDSLNVIFTHNATESLNVALHGLLRSGDHVITSSMEHNSMMRPLRALERQGVTVTVLRCASDGLLDPADILSAIRPTTRLLALNHASNVVGTLQPVADVGHIAREHNLLLLLDTAQTAGACSIDMERDSIDLLAFTGHKALYGPTGTGGLILGNRVDVGRLAPLKRGGTGSRSEEEEQPQFLPDRYESGTLNTIGLAGLGAGVRWIVEQGMQAIRGHEMRLTQQLLDGLRSIRGVTVYGTGSAVCQTATVSFTVDDADPAEIGLQLDEEYGIMCRVGLHCAPTAHKTIGTFPTGTLRFGLGAMNTEEDINVALDAVAKLAI